MTDLLDLVLKAHGGLDRWRDLTELRVVASVGGSTWARDGVLAHTVATVSTRTEAMSFESFGGPGRRSVFTPGHLEIVDAAGRVLAERDDPRSAFAGHPNSSTWDELHTAYYSGYAFWNYLNLPFLLTWDGFRTTEVEPWRENGETWRRLRVEFPDHVATHNAVQTLYFGADDHLLRRHDYNGDVYRGFATAHYTADHREFGGFSLPTRRWVVDRRDDNTTAAGPIRVSIDIASVETRA